MKKTKLFLISLSVVGLIILSIGNRAIGANSESDLVKMAAILERENIMIQEWTLYARNNLEIFNTTNEMNIYVEGVRKKFPNWKWTVSHEDDKWEATAVNSREGVKEKIRILSTVTSKQVQTYTIYEVTGNGWKEEKAEEVLNPVADRIRDIFNGNATTFSCIKGIINDNMNKSLPDNVNGLLEAFDAKEIETLKENSFISTSAYSPVFSETIKGNTKEMNLQLGLREQGLGGNTTVVVGTPIITIEY
jgi:hypothetical protein